MPNHIHYCTKDDKKTQIEVKVLLKDSEKEYNQRRIRNIVDRVEKDVNSKGDDVGQALANAEVDEQAADSLLEVRLFAMFVWKILPF